MIIYPIHKESGKGYYDVFLSLNERAVIWKGLRKKHSDKKKGVAGLMRYNSMSFTRLLRFLNQK